MQVNHPNCWITELQEILFQRVFMTKTHEQTGEPGTSETERPSLLTLS